MLSVEFVSSDEKIVREKKDLLQYQGVECLDASVQRCLAALRTTTEAWAEVGVARDRVAT